MLGDSFQPTADCLGFSGLLGRLRSRERLEICDSLRGRGNNGENGRRLPHKRAGVLLDKSALSVPSISDLG